MIRVTWFDSQQTGDGGWTSREDVCNCVLHPVTTVGYLIHRDEIRLVLAQSIGSGDNIQGVMVIPVFSIHRLEELAPI
jgi:hypothetical protein